MLDFPNLKRGIQCRKKWVIQHVKNFPLCTSSMHLHKKEGPLQPQYKTDQCIGKQKEAKTEL